MILQSLYRYHTLLREDEGNNLPGADYSSVDVSFELQLDETGRLVALIPYTDDKGKIDKHPILVPRQEKRTSGIKPYFLCEKAEYLFGSALAQIDPCRDALRLNEETPTKQNKRVQRLADDREAMKELWMQVLAPMDLELPEIRALQAFLSASPEELADQVCRVADEQIQKQVCGSGLGVLKYAPTGSYVHELQPIKAIWERFCAAGEEGSIAQNGQICLITGELTPEGDIARLHPNIKNVYGAQSSGAALVSFNIESFCSYGRTQSYNAPTSQKAADAYGYVLNKLLSDPSHKVRLNDTTVVFWAESAGSKEQDWLASLFAEFEKVDHPDEESVRARVRSAVVRVQRGQQFTDTFGDLDANTTFYVLGLSPNVSRLSIRFWYTGSLSELGERVWRHFQDLSIAGLERTPTIRELLRELAFEYDWDKIPPNMEGQILRSILLGLPYSKAVFSQLMNRIRADSDKPEKGLRKIGATRAALIKAYLLRYYRRTQNAMEGEITMGLNENAKSVPYHLGRLFACLEKAQAGALGTEVNATIRDRFWGAASTSPATVFPRLLHLAQHHVSKDEKWGGFHDYKIEEVMNSLPSQLPRRLSLEEQGMFALGYYHQRHDFYVKKSDE